MLANHKRFIPYILFAGDLIALILFVAVGQRDHELVNEQSPILGVLLSALYFAAPYLVAGIFLRAFSPIEDVGDGKGRPYIAFFGRWLNTWLVAAPLGILIRTFVLGRAVVPTTFIVAGLGFGGLFMLAWRVLFVLAMWWKNRKPI
jgi:hypothetical protein